MRHLMDDPLPSGAYTAAEAAVVRYARASTRAEPITRGLYADLAAHFSVPQMVDLSLTVGLSNLINRFHATFLTDVDADTLAQVADGDAAAGGGPIPLPQVPRQDDG